MTAQGDARFSECSDANDDLPLRQGDVFEWLQPLPPWRHVGLVITADCDIAQEKHGGIISYTPVLALRDYLRMFYLPRQLSRGVEPVWERFIKLVRVAQAHLPDFPEPISAAALGEWLRSDGPAGIADELAAGQGAERDEIISLGTIISRAWAALEYEDHDLMLAAIIDSRSSQSGDSAKARVNGLAAIRNAIDNLPGDCFFMSSIATSKGPRVVYLRLIREVRQQEIALRQPDLRSTEVKARRVSRLRSPYLYRLTRKLADVFASIGLPTEYDMSRQTLVREVYS